MLKTMKASLIHTLAKMFLCKEAQQLGESFKQAGITSATASKSGRSISIDALEIQRSAEFMQMKEEISNYLKR